MNGIITSVLSYATLPYSQRTYHFAVTLSNVVSPLSSFLPFFVSVRSLPLLGFLTGCSTVVTAFIVYLAALSPNWIFDSLALGSTLSVFKKISKIQRKLKNSDQRRPFSSRATLVLASSFRLASARRTSKRIEAVLVWSFYSGKSIFQNSASSTKFSTKYHLK